LTSWLKFMALILELPIQNDLGSSTEKTAEIERREKHPLWKLKSTAGKITYQLFARYGRTEYVNSWDKEFSQNLVTTFSVLLIKPHLEQLWRFCKNHQFVGTKALTQSLKFIYCCCKIESVFDAHIKPHIHDIIHLLPLKILFVSHKEAQMF
jgi:hypothetical protein